MKYQGKELEIVERTSDELNKTGVSDCTLCCLQPEKTGKGLCDEQALGINADCWNGRHGLAYFQYAKTEE